MNLLILFLSYVVYLLINQFGPLPLELFLLSALPGDERIVSFYQIGCYAINCLIALPVFLAINRMSVNRIKELFAGKRDIRLPVALSAVAALLAATAIPLLALHYFLPEMPIAPPGIVTGIWLVLITPVVEEIVFRGVILQKLMKYGVVPAVLVTTILFSVGHLNMGNMPVSFLPGILLGIVALKTESIAYTIPLHMLVNLCGSVLLPLALSM